VHVGPDVQDARRIGTKAVSMRRAHPRDAGTLAATLAEAIDGYRIWAPAGWSPPDQTAEATHALAQALSLPEVWCLLAECEWNPAGHVALSPRTAVQPEEAPAGTVNLWQLFVRPKWQGRGVAPLLMLAALAETRRRGFTRLRLWTPRDAARARRFYEREGFTLTGNEREESPLGIAIVEYARGVSEHERYARQ
jgi:GNAT superfamily N-acetyltransferase